MPCPTPGHKLLVPSSYDDLLTCIVQVCPTGPDVRLTVAPDSTSGLTLEPSSAGYDGFTFYDTVAGTAWATSPGVGFETYKDTVTMSSVGTDLGGYNRCITAKFLSDISGNAAGGAVWISAVRSSDVSTVFATRGSSSACTGYSRVVVSPTTSMTAKFTDSSSYPGNVNCNTIFVSQTGSTIQMTFTAFNTEICYIGVCDGVKLYSGLTSTAALVLDNHDGTSMSLPAAYVDVRKA